MSRRDSIDDVEAGSDTTAVAARDLDTEDVMPAKSSVADEHEVEPHKAELPAGSVLIDWEGPDDPKNPRNWSYGRRWVATFIVSTFTLLAPLTSTVTAPATEPISEALGISEPVEKQLLTSIFVLAFAAGPLLWGPLSELYGRRVVLQSSNTLYIIFNLVCAHTGRNPAAFYVFRFLSGFGGASAVAIGGGTVGDLWLSHERGQAMAVYSLAPLLGPSIGPVMSSWIAEKTTYHWCFWATTILAVVVQIAGLIWLHETYEPILLERKAKRYRKANPHVDPLLVKTRFSGKVRTPQAVLVKGLSWPFRLMAQEPIVQSVGLIQAVYYGLLYLFTIEIPVVYTQYYGQSLGISGLHYLALGLGFVFTAQVQGRVLDPLYKRLTAKYGSGRPEFRLPPVFIAGPLFPIGTLIFGWAAQSRVHWIVPDIGLVLIGASMISANQATQAYIIDCYAVHAASALAAVFFARSLCGFGFPLFAPSLFSSLGLGGGCSLIAGLTFVLAVPAAPLLWVYGERLRGASRHAKKH